MNSLGVSSRTTSVARGSSRLAFVASRSVSVGTRASRRRQRSSVPRRTRRCLKVVRVRALGQPAAPAFNEWVGEGSKAKMEPRVTASTRRKRMRRGSHAGRVRLDRRRRASRAPKSRRRTSFEPSVVAVDEQSGSIQALGEEARRMIGRTPATIRALRPSPAPPRGDRGLRGDGSDASSCASPAPARRWGGGLLRTPVDFGGLAGAVSETAVCLKRCGVI